MCLSLNVCVCFSLYVYVYSVSVYVSQCACLSECLLFVLVGLRLVVVVNVYYIIC